MININKFINKYLYVNNFFTYLYLYVFFQIILYFYFNKRNII